MRRRCGQGTLLVVAFLQNRHEIARVKITVPVRVAGGPGGVLRDAIFIFTRLEDEQQVGTVEAVIEIGIGACLCNSIDKISAGKFL